MEVSQCGPAVTLSTATRISLSRAGSGRRAVRAVPADPAPDGPGAIASRSHRSGAVASRPRLAAGSRSWAGVRRSRATRRGAAGPGRTLMVGRSWWGGGDGAGSPAGDGRRRPGPPVFVGHMRAAVQQAAPPGAVQRAVHGGPELGRAGRIHLGWRHDVHLPGVAYQQVDIVPPPEVDP